MTFEEVLPLMRKGKIAICPDIGKWGIFSIKFISPGPKKDNQIISTIFNVDLFGKININNSTIPCWAIMSDDWKIVIEDD